VSLPKPVIVVLIVVVVLAVVGCGMTVLGSSQQGRADPPVGELRGSNFTKFFQIFGPPSKEIEDFATTCATANPGVLKVPSSCTINIGSTTDERRQLLLRPLGSSITMTVTIVFPSPQPSANSDSEISTSPEDRDKGSIVLNRGASATIRLDCAFECDVAVNPP